MNNFIRFFLGLALLASFNSARAQDMPASSLETSSEKNALIIELLQTTGSINLIKSVMTRMSETLKHGRSTEEQAKIDKMMGSLNPDELKDQIVAMYSSHFSTHDIQGILAFYKSPVGQKFLKEIPAMTGESMTMGQEWATRKAAEMSKVLD